jgi:hypothetical protein
VCEKRRKGPKGQNDVERLIVDADERVRRWRRHAIERTLLLLLLCSRCSGFDGLEIGIVFTAA